MFTHEAESVRGLVSTIIYETEELLKVHAITYTVKVIISEK